MADDVTDPPVTPIGDRSVSGLPRPTPVPTAVEPPVPSTVEMGAGEMGAVEPGAVEPGVGGQLSSETAGPGPVAAANEQPPARADRRVVYLVASGTESAQQRLPGGSSAASDEPLADSPGSLGPQRTSTPGQATAPGGSSVVDDQYGDGPGGQRGGHEQGGDGPDGDDRGLDGQDGDDQDGDDQEEDDHRDWAWVEEWRSAQEPTPWATGLVLTAFSALVVGVAIWVLCAGLADRPVIAVLINVLVAAGLAPAIWLSRSLPVLRWIAAGAVLGVVAGWVAAILMLPMPLP